MFRQQVMDYQVNVIKKTIGPFFADPVTFIKQEIFFWEIYVNS